MSMTFRVLMVCTGNICRSTMAHQVLQQALTDLRRNGENLDVIVDSAGVSNEEQGNPIDRRAARVLRDAGYTVHPHAARQIRPHELGTWDLILAMTGHHRSNLVRLADMAGVERAENGELGDHSTVDIRMFRSFDPHSSAGDIDVPDPWYGGHQDFLDTLDVVERTTPQIINHIRHALAH